jgi:hypothetical protein
MAEHENLEVHEKPRHEDHLVYALLALPVFAISVVIIFLIATFGTK